MPNNEYSIFELGLDPWMRKTQDLQPAVSMSGDMEMNESASGIAGTTSVLPSVTLSENGVITNTIAEPVSPNSIVAGELGAIISHGKKTFSDTVAGFIMGLDADGTYKWLIGDSASSIDWNVTTANTLTISGGVLAITSGTIAGMTISSTALTATSGGNTTIVSSGSTAFTAGPTGSPTFTVTQAGVLTSTSAVIGGFTIAATTITATNLVLDSAGQRISLGSSNDIVILDADDATYRLWVGNATAASATFSVTKAGAIFATSGAVGGWTLGATTLTGGNATLDSAGKLTLGTSNDVVILDATDSTYRLAIGNATYANAPFRVTKAGVATATNITITGGSVVTSILSGIVDLSNVNVAAQGWIFSGTWSVTDADTVAWGAGTFTTAGGTAYSISGSNTGNMAAKTYIYLDINVSTTAFQTTTTLTTAIGSGKVLVAIAQNGTGEATYIVLNDKAYNIDAANIVASSITANEIAANTITGTNILTLNIAGKNATFDTGTVGSWTMASGYLYDLASGTPTSSPSAGVVIDSVLPAFRVYNSTTETIRVGNLNGFLGYVSDLYGIAIGSSTAYLKYDPTNGLRIEGPTIIDAPATYQLTAGEALTAGDSVQLGFNVIASTLIASDDSYTDSTSTGTNHGSDATVNTRSGGTTLYGWFKFSFANLPTTNLTSATFYFKTSGGGADGTQTIKKVTGADWAEGTITYDNQPAVGATIGSVATPSTSTLYSIDVTSQVSAWLSGADANYGMRMEGSSTGTTTTIHSSEAASNSDRPYLVLVYDTTKIFKSKSDVTENTTKWLGFAAATASADATVRVQLNDIYTTSSLTAGSIYYLSNTRGAISTSAGTVTKKVGLAITTTKLFIDRVV